jgi:hypothetical protein
MIQFTDDAIGLVLTPKPEGPIDTTAEHGRHPKLPDRPSPVAIVAGVDKLRTELLSKVSGQVPAVVRRVFAAFAPALEAAQRHPRDPER